MKSNVKIIDGNKREIELEIEAKEVMEEFEKIVAQFSSRAKIPGFRPGKVPRDLVKQRFYPEIKESLINSLVPQALSTELKAQNLKPIGMPVVNDLHFQEGEPLRFKAQFEVWPEFELPEYKKIKIKKKTSSVTDKEVNQSLEELRLRAAEYVPVENRGVVDGDYVIAELKGKDLKTNKLLPTEKVVILAGQPENDEILNKSLLELMPGNETNLVLDYEKNHQNKKLAGKKIEYNLKVTAIKEKKLPDINDEFAKDLGEYKDLKELKEKIIEEIYTSKESHVKKEQGEEIIKKISSELAEKIPESLVQQEYMAILRHRLSSHSQHEIKEEDIDELKVEGMKKAEENIKNHLILQKIAKKENITVSDEEIHEEIKTIAKANNVPLATVVDSLNKEGKRDELRNNLLIKKTVDFLVKHAIIE